MFMRARRAILASVGKIVSHNRVTEHEGRRAAWRAMPLHLAIRCVKIGKAFGTAKWIYKNGEIIVSESNRAVIDRIYREFTFCSFVSVGSGS